MHDSCKQSGFHTVAPANETVAATQRQQPRIVLLGTGGTIASSAAPATQLHDYSVTATIDAVLAAVPQVWELARIRCEQVVNIDSHAIDNTVLLMIARRVQAVLQEPDVDGVVLTHGTDTLEETAYF